MQRCGDGECAADLFARGPLGGATGAGHMRLATIGTVQKTSPVNQHICRMPIGCPSHLQKLHFSLLAAGCH